MHAMGSRATVRESEHRGRRSREWRANPVRERDEPSRRRQVSRSIRAISARRVGTARSRSEMARARRAPGGAR